MKILIRKEMCMKQITKTKDEYQKVIKNNQSTKGKITNIIKAFFIGGLFCSLGQSLWYLFMTLNFSQNDAGALSTVTMILLGSLLTGFGVYDEIGQFGGAGSLIPVTGFANAVVAPAMDGKQDGLILGLGTQMFNVAGPVLVYAMVSAFLIGLLKLMLGG